MVRRSLLAGALTVSVLLFGCGGDGDDGADLVERPEPADPLAHQVTVLNEAIAEQSCDSFVPLLHSFTRQTTDPGAPPARGECRIGERRLRTLRGIEFTDSAEYGTGGLSESERPSVVMVWTVDRDRAFRIESAAGAEPQIGTSGDTQQAEAVAEELIAAVEEEDCKHLESLLDPEGRLVADSGGEPCKAVLQGALFAPALRATPDASAEVLGSTRDFGFAGVATADAYFTVVLTRQGDELKVLDVVPSTPVELRPQE